MFFKSKDGIRLCGIWHLPDKKTTKAIILAHGITVNKDEDGTFIHLAEVLKGKGFAVFRFDFLGHGESEGKTINATISGEIIDVESAVNYVNDQGYKEISLLGASFGGGIATLFTSKNQEKIKSLCLWNPVLNYDHCFLNPITLWLKEKKDQMKKDLANKGWTAIGSSKTVYGKQFFEEMTKFFPYKELKKIKIQIIILHSDRDTYVLSEDSTNYIKGVGELYLMKGSDHGFHTKKLSKNAINKTVDFFIKSF